jgi:uncharacterized protein
MKPYPVVHFELPGEDTERMKKFYETAFGWKMETMGDDMGGYIVARTSESDPNEPSGRPKNPGMINGGLFKKSDDALMGSPSIVIAVDDIMESMEQVKAAGGTIHGEVLDIPTVGKFVSFIDTEGNRSSMIQPQGMGANA